MTGERFSREDEEAPKSRRELRRERQRKKGGLTGSLTRRRTPTPSEGTEERLWKEEAPKSRRELRQRRELLQKRRREKKRRSGLVELFVTILVAFVLVFGLVRPFFVEAFRIPSESMVPTLEVGDRVLANKFVYRFAEPERGDIVVFDSVDESDDQTLIERVIGLDDQTLIKRVVGVEGDEIEVQSGLLFVNGRAQEEPYLNQGEAFRGRYGPREVPEGYVFVMGDNRSNSGDSRIFGPVPLENVKGEAFLRFWPISEIEAL